MVLRKIELLDLLDDDEDAISTVSLPHQILSKSVVDFMFKDFVFRVVVMKFEVRNFDQQTVEFNS